MTYQLGNVKPWVRDAANEIGPKYGIRTVYGYSYRNIAGTTTLSDHARGLALDFMCGIDVGNQLAAYVQANAARLSVTYIIHNRRIWSVARSREGWRPYSGVNPHTDHVHVSFADKPGSGGSANATSAGYIPLPIIPHLGHGGGPGLPIGPGGKVPSGKTVEDVWNALSAMGKLAAFIANPASFLRVLMFLGGLALLALAITTLVTQQGVGQTAAQAGKTVGKTVARTAARTTAKAASNAS